MQSNMPPHPPYSPHLPHPQHPQHPAHPQHPPHLPHPQHPQHPPHLPHTFVCNHEHMRPHTFTGHQEVAVWSGPSDLSLVPAGPAVDYRPARQPAAAGRDIGSSVESDKEKFQVNLDVQNFTPEEISVKVVDGYIVVECKHEEKKDDHGYVSRQLTRRYALPEGCVPDTVVSMLSSDGVLIVVAPKKVPPVLEGERDIPIIRTGPVRHENNKKPSGDPA